MNVTIRKGSVRGSIDAPSSKSMTHRALLCAALAQGESTVRSPLVSDDTEATVRVLRQLGIEIKQALGVWTVTGRELTQPDGELYCGDSATTLRLMTAVCALVDGDCRLTGGASLSRRPVGPLLDALGQLGVECESDGGTPPVTVHGRGGIDGGEAEIRGDVSSQFVSALLLISPLTRGLTINVTTPLESKPYVELTLDAMSRFGVDIQSSGDMRSYRTGRQDYRPADITVEGDWSSASHLLAAGALAGEVEVRNLGMGSRQADTAIADILRRMSAEVNMGGNTVTVQKSSLKGIECDLSDSPDIFPIVAALCAVAEGESKIHGLRRLRIKESDRVAAMMDGLGRMGIGSTLLGDSVKILGGTPKGAAVDSQQDHRIAMSLAVLALAAEGETMIRGAECVSKSYPGFWGDLEAMGACIVRDGDE